MGGLFEGLGGWIVAALFFALVCAFGMSLMFIIGALVRLRDSTDVQLEALREDVDDLEDDVHHRTTLNPEASDVG